MTGKPRQAPKQQRSIETRQAILEAAAEVFDKEGYAGSRITEIMTRAGVTQGALYFHFASKLDLAQVVMNAQGEGIELPPGEDGLQRLIDLCLLLARELQTNKLLRAGVRLAVEQEEIGFHDLTPYELWVGQFSKQLTAAAANGELHASVDVDNLAQLLVGCYTGVQHFSKIRNNRNDLLERIEDLLRSLLLGIAPARVAAKVSLDLDREHGDNTVPAAS